MNIGRNKHIADLKAYIKRHGGAVKKISIWAMETYRGSYMKFARARYGISKNKVVFNCFNARTYGDNLKPISEALHAICPEADIVWMFREPEKKKSVVPPYVRCVDPITRKGLFEYATARVWLDNFTLQRYFKRKIGSQFYMNTWHGDRAFKKIAYDAFPDSRRRIEETCDIMLAGSNFGEKLLRSAFRYNGEILTNGCPRNDILARGDAEPAKRAKKTLNIPDNAKLLIYAPTFRDTRINERIDTGVNLERALDALEKNTGEKWLCLFRAHQLSVGGINVDANERMINATKYEDMADLLAASDAILTDYSSSAMDFAVTGRRVFIYQADIADYTSRDRQLYYPMETSPFLIAHDNDELEKIILATDDKAARENCDKIAEFFGHRETGRSAEAAAERIYKWLKM